MCRLLALMILATFFTTCALVDDIEGVEIAPEVDAPYARTMYGSWRDADGDCRNTRDELLIAENLLPVILCDDGCEVIVGLWFDPYTQDIHRSWRSRYRPSRAA